MKVCHQPGKSLVPWHTVVINWEKEGWWRGLTLSLCLSCSQTRQLKSLSWRTTSERCISTARTIAKKRDAWKVSHISAATFHCWAELKDDNADTQRETQNVTFPMLSTLKKCANSQSNLGRLRLKKQEDMWLQSKQKQENANNKRKKGCK